VAEEARETALWMGAEVTLVCDVGVAGPQRLLAHLDKIQAADAVVVIAAGGYHSLALIAAEPQPFTLGAPQWMPDGSFRWMLFGEAGRNYTVQSSTNLTLWTDLQTVALSVSSVQITDTNASAFPRRFYRVRTQ